MINTNILQLWHEDLQPDLPTPTYLLMINTPIEIVKHRYRYRDKSRVEPSWQIYEQQFRA